MDCHDHNYTQIPIGLKGQAEFEVCGSGNVVGPGAGVLWPPELTTLLVALLVSQIFWCWICLFRWWSFSPAEDKWSSLVMMCISNSMVKFRNWFSFSFWKCNLPDDLLLSRACSDTVTALLQRHISSFSTHRKDSRFDLEAVDRYIEQHLSRRILSHS